MDDAIQIDEHGAQVFAAMGFEGELPKKLVETYNGVKLLKDRAQPGRLSYGLMALIAYMAEEHTEAKPEPKTKAPQTKKIEKPDVGSSVFVEINGQDYIAIVAEGEVDEGQIAVIVDGDENKTVRTVSLTAIKG